jgi:hypothetical protein
MYDESLAVLPAPTFLPLRGLEGSLAGRLGGCTVDKLKGSMTTGREGPHHVE